MDLNKCHESVTSARMLLEVEKNALNVGGKCSCQFHSKNNHTTHLIAHENWSGDGHKMVFIQLALTLLKVPSRITFKMRSKKRSYGRGGNMDGTLIQWDIANNFKKMPNLSQRIWPKGNTTFLFQSLLEQCPTCRGTLNVTNWRQCINYSHYTCQKYGLICVSVSWRWKCWCWFYVIDLHMMSTK